MNENFQQWTLTRKKLIADSDLLNIGVQHGSG